MTNITEQRNDRFGDMDALSTEELMYRINDEDAKVAAAVRLTIPQAAAAAEHAAAGIAKGGRLIYVGAGTSGRLGVLDASECPPTFGVPDGMVVGIIAGGDVALRTAVEGAEDSEALAMEELDRLRVCAKDVVVAISASGTAPYCVGALKKAREAGALPVSMCCNTCAKLSGYADIAIEMPTGAEVLSGSTRLRAGTATKLALNMISTACMVRMGKAYKNLMVDVRATNTKLKDRAVRIAMKAMNVQRAEAEARLAAADGNIKCAIVMKETGASRDAAMAALEMAQGFTRRAIEALG